MDKAFINFISRDTLKQKVTVIAPAYTYVTLHENMQLTAGGVSSL